MKALSSLFAISALALVPSLANADSGVSTDIYISQSTAAALIGPDGESADLPDGFDINYLLIDLGVNYAVSDEIGLKLTLPVVMSNSSSPAIGEIMPATDMSTTGLGDVGLEAHYMTKLNDMASVGGALRFQMAIGEDGSTENSVPTSLGSHQIQASFMAALAPVDNLSLDIDAGYAFVMANTANGITAQPGAVMTANLYAGYDISGVTPRVGMHYFSMGETKGGAEGGELAAETDSDRNAIGVSADVGYALSDTMSLSAGLGTRLIARGINAPWGMALSGKNVMTGMAFNLGFNAAF